MDYSAIISKMRARHAVKDGDPLGVLGLHCQAYVPSAAERDVEGVMTTVDTDLDEEVVVAGGGDLSYFNNAGQRKVFVDHQYDMASNVGVVRWCNPYPNATNPTGLKARIHVYTGLRHPLADDVWSRIEQGGMGLSVGYVPIDQGKLTAAEKAIYPKAKSIVRKWKMLEVSFTAIPCNVSCQTLTVPGSPKSITISPEPRIITIG